MIPWCVFLPETGTRDQNNQISINMNKVTNNKYENKKVVSNKKPTGKGRKSIKGRRKT